MAAAHWLPRFAGGPEHRRTEGGRQPPWEGGMKFFYVKNGEYVQHRHGPRQSLSGW